MRAARRVGVIVEGDRAIAEFPGNVHRFDLFDPCAEQEQCSRGFIDLPCHCESGALRYVAQVDRWQNEECETLIRGEGVRGHA